MISNTLSWSNLGLSYFVYDCCSPQLLPNSVVYQYDKPQPTGRLPAVATSGRTVAIYFSVNKKQVNLDRPGPTCSDIRPHKSSHVM